MAYPRFLLFSIGGGLLWVCALVYSGFFFGNLPIVRQNLSIVILAIIAASIAPIAFEVLRTRLRKA